VYLNKVHFFTKALPSLTLQKSLKYTI